MSGLLAWLAKLLVGMFTGWVGEQERTQQTKQAGAAEQELKQEQADDKVVEKAVAASDAARASGVRWDDPNFRD